MTPDEAVTLFVLVNAHRPPHTRLPPDAVPTLDEWAWAITVYDRLKG